MTALKPQTISATILEPGVRDGESIMIRSNAIFMDIPQQQVPQLDFVKAATPFDQPYEVLRYRIVISAVTGRVLVVHPAVFKYLQGLQ
jgi:hypothetical protein